MNFPYTMGIETTAFFPDFEDDGADELVDAYKNILRYELIKGKIEFHGCAVDTGVIEISSKVHKNKKTLLTWARKIFKKYRSHKLEATHQDHVDGGNHIHVGGMDYRLRAAIVRDLIMRPYLVWIFTDPDDTESTNNVIHRAGQGEYTKNLIDKKSYKIMMEEYEAWERLPEKKVRDCWSFSGYRNEKPRMADWLENSLRGKQFVEMLFYADLRKKDYTFAKDEVTNSGFFGTKDDLLCLTRYDTLEFRLFEATHDIRRLNSYIDFIQAYIMWIEARLLKGDVTKVVLETREKFQARTADDSLKEFEALLKKLDLPFSDYKALVKKNLYPRWENDRKRV